MLKDARRLVAKLADGRELTEVESGAGGEAAGPVALADTRAVPPLLLDSILD